MKLRVLLVAGLFLAGFTFATAGSISGSDTAHIRSQSTGTQGGLRAAVDRAANESQSPTWIVYEVEGVSPEFFRCCLCEDEPVACRLDGDKNQSLFHTDDSERGISGKVLVALRVGAGKVEKIRFYSGDCELDAGDAHMIRLDGVSSGESVAYLSRFVEEVGGDSNARPKRSEAVSAIAAHAGSAADEALERFTAPDRPGKLRKQAAFWLGVARGARGFAVLQKLVRHEDDDSRFRKELVFAIHVSKESAAAGELIRLAREDSSRKVRKAAIFWIAQRAGKESAAALSDFAENDPDTAIQKQAVFGISQLPPEEGIPILIKIAKTHPKPAVRKQAFFWLGETGDPRALDFFEQILTR